MGLKCISSLFIFLFACNFSYAMWEDHITVLHGVFGASEKQFGIKLEDTSDSLPELSAVVPGGEIIVNDIVNNRIQVFSSDGSFLKEVKWEKVINEKGDEEYFLPEFGVFEVYRFTKDGNVLINGGDGVYLKNPHGITLAIYGKNSLMIGIRSAHRRAGIDNKYDTTIEFEDATYRMILDGNWDKFVRDQKNYLNFYNSYTDKDPVSGEDSETSLVVRYNRCGKLTGQLDLPISEYEPLSSVEKDMPTTRMTVRNEYGPPVIGPDGSVYAWKRTPTTYSILKWAWVDSPDDPQGGPDAPLDLKVAPSTDGLFLTWTASPQDPGCVEGYEVERSSTFGGIFSNLTNTSPGVVKYNDTGAFTGSTYYYRIRAKSSCGPSPYTAEISGKRP